MAEDFDKKIIKREQFRGSSGETLAETLISVLIISLASVTLAAMIGSAANMNVRAREFDTNLDNVISTISEPSSSPPPQTTVETKSTTMEMKNTEGKIITVKFPRSEDNTECKYSVSVREVKSGETVLSAYEKGNDE